MDAIAVATQGQALVTAIGLLSVPAVIVLGVIVALWYRFMERRSASGEAAPALSNALPDLESSHASTST